MNDILRLCGGGARGGEKEEGPAPIIAAPPSIDAKCGGEWF